MVLFSIIWTAVALRGDGSLKRKRKIPTAPGIAARLLKSPPGHQWLGTLPSVQGKLLGNGSSCCWEHAHCCLTVCLSPSWEVFDAAHCQNCISRLFCAEAWVLGEWGIHKRAREMGSLADAAEAPPASAPQEPSYPTPSSQKCRSRWRGCRYGAGVQECFSASQAEQHLCRWMAQVHLCYPMQHCHRACVFPQHLNHLSYIL